MNMQQYNSRSYEINSMQIPYDQPAQDIKVRMRERIRHITELLVDMQVVKDDPKFKETYEGMVDVKNEMIVIEGIVERDEYRLTREFNELLV